MPSNTSNFNVNTSWNLFMSTKDQRYFTRVVEHIQPRIASYLRKKISDHESIADIVSETVMILWNKRDTYNDRFNFTTWCFNIAHNVAISHMRKHSRDIKFMNKNINIYSENTQNTAYDDSVSYYTDDDIEMIKRSITDMPNSMKVVFVRYYMHRKKIREISIETGLTASTVKARLVAGRKWAQDFLKTRDVEFKI